MSDKDRPDPITPALQAQVVDLNVLATGQAIEIANLKLRIVGLERENAALRAPAPEPAAHERLYQPGPPKPDGVTEERAEAKEEA